MFLPRCCQLSWSWGGGGGGVITATSTRCADTGRHSGNLLAPDRALGRPATVYPLSCNETLISDTTLLVPSSYGVTLQQDLVQIRSQQLIDIYTGGSTCYLSIKFHILSSCSEGGSMTAFISFSGDQPARDKAYATSIHRNKDHIVIPLTRQQQSRIKIQHLCGGTA